MGGVFDLRRWNLATALAVVVCAVLPSTALGATLANGVYTAEPGESIVVQVLYEPATDTYSFKHYPIPSDADGPGGCFAADFQARCPASAISKIVINGSDQKDLISIGPGGFITIPTGGFSDANQVRIPAEVYGRDGPDVITGGWGADVIDGGPGTDLVDGNEVSMFGATPDSMVRAQDLLSCGTGGDFGDANPITGNGFTEVDTATIGEGDAVGIDCEAIQQRFTCPPGGPECFGVAPVEAITGAPGKSAAASGKRSAGKRTVVLGTGKFKLRPGQPGQVITRLKPKRVRRVIGGDKSVSARSSLVAKKKGRKKLLDRTRFRLTNKG
jgi:hypothetical protein